MLVPSLSLTLAPLALRRSLVVALRTTVLRRSTEPTRRSLTILLSLLLVAVVRPRVVSPLSLPTVLLRRSLVSRVLVVVRLRRLIVRVLRGRVVLLRRGVVVLLRRSIVVLLLLGWGVVSSLTLTGLFVAINVSPGVRSASTEALLPGLIISFDQSERNS
jgi:hypothetical protein